MGGIGVAICIIGAVCHIPDSLFGMLLPRPLGVTKVFESMHLVLIGGIEMLLKAFKGQPVRCRVTPKNAELSAS
ncbi:hypothetical protein Poly59_06780 [Rubripirellula reticaptiva]|uniref:Uncharacterized protein n=1 Tax=Rubripirellula reticaptiva TaxID=2528013 RepID=A0A5C6FDR5_9BACT|nr:hypothetical protein Poly59_06780 [Rubripirellula reticaptiva]